MATPYEGLHEDFEDEATPLPGELALDELTDEDWEAYIADHSDHQEQNDFAQDDLPDYGNDSGDDYF